MAHLHDYSAVRQRQLQKLQDIRENLNYSETETNGPELLGRLEELFLNWKGYLPYLRDIFGQEVIEHLLLVSVKSAHSNNGSEGRSFVNFVVSSGYKDEPNVDEKGKPVSRRDTALHCAARLKCEKNIVRQLFDIYHNNKFDVNYVDGSGVSHFHVACEYGFEYAVENFLEHGHDPKCVVPGSGDSTLHMAMRVRIGITVHEYYQSKGLVELLLRGGVDPNLANEKGETPLHIISQKDYECEMVELFFRINDESNQLVQINARDKLGNTPLHVALKIQKKKVVELLLRRGADPTLANEKGDTPLHLICEKDSDGSLMELFFDVVENLGKIVQVDARNHSNETPLKLALRHKKKTIAESLLRYGANPNQVNEANRTFLHEFCSAGQIDLAEIFFKIDSENRRPVLVDVLDNEGNAPLHLSLEYEQKEAVELLLRNGADPNLARTMDGYTPLHIICRKKEDSFMKIFFDINDANNQKVDIDAKADEGNTPLHLALRFQFAKMAELLLRRGADPNSANDKGETPLDIICKDHRDNVDLVRMMFKIVDEKDQPVKVDELLQSAVANRLVKVTILLLKRGADPTFVNAKGETPLGIICKDHSDNVDLVRMMFMIVDEKHQPVKVDELLQSAVANRLVKVTKLLLKRGADPTFVNAKKERLLWASFVRITAITLTW
ncbi:unnamed protein product [Trichogramma brassicae]|uniref:Uncharacterized protein n=1 Tax=Trichogramma brassicae TaxID=86971 RepID=A0A6H5I0J2_9HYME|nr:unnamed protein product [Trichogramma brassicae]